ncbi:MAG: SDR family oxidoreductase [Streptosporangiaceae bacterium]
MRLLVTGGSGFLGGYVLDEARRRGHEVVALARSDTATAAVARHGAEPLPGDFDDPAGLPEAFSSAQCSSLLNIASLGFGHAPAILGATRAAGIDRVVFISTTAVTTRLPARSRAVRLMAEEQIRESGLKWTTLRPTMIYGAPGDRNLSRLLALLARVPVLPVPGGGRHLQQPVHVADVAAAVLSAVERPESAGTTYDIAGPEPLSFAELLRITARAVGSRTRFLPVPLSPLVAAARGYELLAARPRIRAEQLQRLAEDKAFSIKDAARDLGYAPRSFAEGIVAEARALGLTQELSR